MTAAEAVLADRDRLNAETTELGLAFPAALEPAYETAATATDLTTLDGRIATWLKAADAVRSARDALAAARAPLVTVGLLGTRPEAAYAAALAAFAAGDDSGPWRARRRRSRRCRGPRRSAAGAPWRSAPGWSSSCVLLLLVVGLLLRARRRRRAGEPPARRPAVDAVGSDAVTLASRTAGPRSIAS